MLIGNGALANYHDLDASDRADFEAWHTTQHIPERVSVPGFMRGRRYVATDGEPQFFILYEVNEVDVLRAPAYLERLNGPTPWTCKVSGTMTLTLRTACVVTETMGQGVGDYCATWQISPSGDRARARRSLVRDVFPVIGDISDVLGVHLLEADADVTAVDTAEKSVRQGDDAMSDWIVMIEADTPDTISAIKAMIEHSVGFSTSHAAWSVYQLQVLQRDIDEI